MPRRVNRSYRRVDGHEPACNYSADCSCGKPPIDVEALARAMYRTYRDATRSALSRSGADVIEGLSLRDLERYLRRTGAPRRIRPYVCERCQSEDLYPRRDKRCRVCGGVLYLEPVQDVDR